MQSIEHQLKILRESFVKKVASRFNSIFFALDEIQSLNDQLGKEDRLFPTLRLLDYYYLRSLELAIQDHRTQLIVWIVENYPTHEVCLEPVVQIDPNLDSAGYARVSLLMSSNIEKNPNNYNLIKSAIEFHKFFDKELTEKIIIDALRTADPTYLLKDDLSSLYRLHQYKLKQGLELKRFLATSGPAYASYYHLCDSPFYALDAEDIKVAKQAAEKLKKAASNPQPNCDHIAGQNAALTMEGIVALRNKDIKKAKSSLENSIVHLSPRDLEAGLFLELARELLNYGERECVLNYLDKYDAALGPGTYESTLLRYQIEKNIKGKNFVEPENSQEFKNFTRGHELQFLNHQLDKHLPVNSISSVNRCDLEVSLLSCQLREAKLAKDEVAVQYLSNELAQAKHHLEQLIAIHGLFYPPDDYDHGDVLVFNEANSRRICSIAVPFCKLYDDMMQSGIVWHNQERWRESLLEADETVFLLKSKMDELGDVTVYADKFLDPEKFNELLEVLEITSETLKDMEPSIRLKKYELWRQDDNGNQAMIEVLPCRADANAKVKMYTDRGHKQMYWCRPSDKGSSK